METLPCEICLIVRHHIVPVNGVILVVQVYDALGHSVVDELPSSWEHSEYVTVISARVAHAAAQMPGVL